MPMRILYIRSWRSSCHRTHAAHVAFKKRMLALINAWALACPHRFRVSGQDTSVKPWETSSPSPQMCCRMVFWVGCLSSCRFVPLPTCYITHPPIAHQPGHFVHTSTRARARARTRAITHARQHANVHRCICTRGAHTHRNTPSHGNHCLVQDWALHVVPLLKLMDDGFANVASRDQRTSYTMSDVLHLHCGFRATHTVGTPQAVYISGVCCSYGI